jgi:hypothetical protein
LRIDLRNSHESPGEAYSASDKPGLEVGTLLGLVVNSGGHLWIEAEPAGGMVLKIHLPKRASVQETERTPASLLDRGRLAKWFRTRSAAVAGS